MKMFTFWYRWLLGVSVYLAVFGLFLAVFPQSSLIDFALNNQVDPVFWDGEHLPPGSERFQAWIYGVLGATIAGWGTLMSFVVYHPFKRREKWAWNCLAMSFALWYVVDTSLSVFYGVFFNVLFNTALLSLVAFPLGFTRRCFSEQDNQP